MKNDSNSLGFNRNGTMDLAASRGKPVSSTKFSNESPKRTLDKNRDRDPYLSSTTTKAELQNLMDKRDIKVTGTSAKPLERENMRGSMLNPDTTKALAGQGRDAWKKICQ